MTWARSQGNEEQKREPSIPTLGSYAFFLVLSLNPERMTGDFLPEVNLREAGASVSDQ